ncbi:hypothetical protein F4X33_08695 [Candidatus Poribacteria bacterium]|nr:hypothetical protein [Candidatus Poribacteria bacterium]
MIFMIDEDNCDNIIKRAYKPQFDGRLVSVKYDLEKDMFSSVMIERNGTPSTAVYSIEKDTIYSIDTSGNITPIMYICNDPSHPPIVKGFGQKTLYQQISDRVADYVKAGVEYNEITGLMLEKVVPMLNIPSDCVSDGGRLQGMRRQIARDWGEVFCKLDNLVHLTGWFINDCQLDNDELHFVLGLFSFEATRTLFATVNQLRAGLASETFVYWRTLYETLVKSSFMLKFSKTDADLPGRFLYYTNSAYLKFYSMFAPEDDPHVEDNMWIKSERQYEARYEKQGKGSYGWVYPLIKNKKGEPVIRPTFRQIINEVDKRSRFSEIYYGVSTAKSHGQFVWNSLMVRPEGRGTHSDPFSVGNIALVMELMMPLFEEILEKTAESCSKPDHSVVMGIVKAAITDINNSVAKIKASDPEMHGGAT